jgi:predicted transcriptional regulator
MKTVTFEVRAFDDTLADIASSLRSGAPETEARISFDSWEVMYRVLAPNRLALVRTMAGKEPLSIRELARLVERDFKGVHTDVTALLNAGVLDKNSAGKISFPYEHIHVEFDIPVAA